MNECSPSSYLCSNAAATAQRYTIITRKRNQLNEAEVGGVEEVSDKRRGKINRMSSKEPPSIEPAIEQFLANLQAKNDKTFPSWDLDSVLLPSLPVPDLEMNMKRYLDVIEPVASEEDFQRTKLQVEALLKGNGPRLQTILKEYATTQINWALSLWLPEMYLSNPVPCLPVWSNPGMVLGQKRFNGDEDMLMYAAKWIRGALNFKHAIDEKKIPIDRARHREFGQPFCMMQYGNIFTHYRRPDVQCDKHISQIGKAPQRHIIVVHNGQFVKTPVYSKNGNRLSESQLKRQLTESLRICRTMDEQRIGLLTSQDRWDWARDRESMIKTDERNLLNFNAIEEALFMINFDNEDVRATETEKFGRMIHGGEKNYYNRWYDKPMQFVIAADGVTGLCYEHSIAEGIAVITIIDHIIYFINNLHTSEDYPSADCDAPEALKWIGHERISTSFAKAKTHISDLVARLDLNVLLFEGFGKELPKKLKFSPDSFIQLALQLAHFRYSKIELRCHHGQLTHTYESASIRRYKHSRVDNIRGASIPALKWCQSMERDDKSESRQLLIKAMEYQTDYMLKSILGDGLDNHLLGLMKMAQFDGIDEPLFTDQVYMDCQHFKLSTSQVTTVHENEYMGYGPVVQDGYGCSYNLRENSVTFCISSMKDCKSTNTSLFGEYLSRALIDMRDLHS